MINFCNLKEFFSIQSLHNVKCKTCLCAEIWRWFPVTIFPIIWLDNCHEMHWLQCGPPSELSTLGQRWGPGIKCWHSLCLYGLRAFREKQEMPLVVELWFHAIRTELRARNAWVEESYAIKNQRKASNAPSRGHFVPKPLVGGFGCLELVLYGTRELA